MRIDGHKSIGRICIFPVSDFIVSVRAAGDVDPKYEGGDYDIRDPYCGTYHVSACVWTVMFDINARYLLIWTT